MSDQTFDYVVTGAGSAGCAVAARLAETGKYRVLLLEAGGKDSNFWIHVPLGYARTFVNPKVNWMFDSEPEANLNKRVMYQPRGKVLGGTSSINGMSTCAATTPTTTTGVSAAAKAGTSSRCYRISARRRTTSGVRRSSTAAAAHCGSPTSRTSGSWPPDAEGLHRCGHRVQPRLQRRAAGRLWLLPDHDEGPPSLEHRGSVSATGAQAA